MVNYTFVIIGGLILIIYLMSTVPAVDNGVTEGVNTLQDKVKSSFNKGETSKCPTTYQPVCADGITYDNLCLAAEAGKGIVTDGVCIP